MKNLYLQALEFFSMRDDLALATVICANGSTPQKAGCNAIIGPEGIITGTIGGGKIENEIVQLIKNGGKNGIYSFSLNNVIGNKDDSICGGQMDILVDTCPLEHRSVFEELAESLINGPGTLITTIQKSDDPRILRQWISGNPGSQGCRLTNVKGSLVFSEPVYPASKLIIAGGGHIGKALAHLGSLLEFEVTVIDDRAEYANKENLPDADHIITSGISQAVHNTVKNSDTFIVIVTHNHSSDADALKSCIDSGAGYIGMIGSKRKIALMREKFLNEKWATEQQWDKIHAPVGIDIKSQTVQEIAVSIAAELVLVRNLNKTGNG
jgi:xanthine dehydrogenase accessory factor